MHSPTLVPIVPPKYDIGFIVKNCNSQLLTALEPWCSTIYIDDDMDVLTTHYIDKEQKNTDYLLKYKIRPFDNEKMNEILVEIDGHTFNQSDFVNIQRLSQIIESSGEIGKFELENLSIEIIQINEYTKDLIKL